MDGISMNYDPSFSFPRHSLSTINSTTNNKLLNETIRNRAVRKPRNRISLRRKRGFNETVGRRNVQRASGRDAMIDTDEIPTLPKGSN